MIRSESNSEVIRQDNVAGGKGPVYKTILVKADESFEKARMVAKITLPPGSEIGEHSHVKDAEIYYILKGEVCVTDNDERMILRKGDVVFTGNGNFHGIKNKSSENAEFLAVIIN